MEPIKYPYSTFQNIFSTLLILGLNFFPFYMIVRFPALPASLFLGALLLGTVAMAVYLCKKFFFPLLRGKTALEIDKDKLQFFITNRTIYWKDVIKIDYFSLNHGGWSIKFVMRDGNEDLSISTKYVAGNDATIYDAIVEYFEKHK
jgi:hypothetical protein